MFLIDLEAGTCTSHNYQVSGVPCGHAMRAIQRKAEAPIDDKFTVPLGSKHTNATRWDLE
jgi:hypothetical protein